LTEDLTIRCLTGVDELELFGGLHYTLDEELVEDLVAGVRRPSWMWVALRGEQLAARAAWWGAPADQAPAVLDFLDLSDAPDRVEIGVRLLKLALSEILPSGSTPPDFVRFVAPDWRQQPIARALIEDLMSIVAATGGHLLAERFRFQWEPGTPIAAPTGRIAFRAVRDDHELLELMVAVMDGTLDAHSREHLARMSARDAAIRHLEEELACYTTPRAWWQIATRPGGEPVGFVIPAHNRYGPIIAYLGVLPADRGNGYINEILAEGTRILAAQDPPRIRASTDLGNVPMAQAFNHAGWINFERSINMTWRRG
jgi:GNAT superfamily N-acetyltransferase